MRVLLLIFLLSLSTLGQGSFIEDKFKILQCKACHDMVAIVQASEKNIDDDIKFFVQEIGLALCLAKRVEAYSVCFGAVSEMIPAIIESIVQRYLDAEEICPLIKLCPQVYERLSEFDYVKEIIADKPINSEWPEVIEGGKKIRLIHISDLHFDFQYQTGSKAVCDYPLCCRQTSGNVHKGDIEAGYWGTLSNCNIPFRTIEQLFSFIKEHIYKEGEQIMLVWTGDNTSHDVWKQNRDTNTLSTIKITDLMKKTFPNREMIIIPQVGNHESYPVNVFDFKSDRELSFRSKFAEQWKDWIGVEQANSFQKYGFYKVEIHEWNLKVITFDSQICNPQNWYLIKDPTDPAGFLEWARQELIESEKNDQAVYITAHIYTSGCLEAWGIRFKALVDRFSRIIRCQIYGHSHGEFLQLYRGYSKNETLNVAYISSSVTTFIDKNPSFRVFEIDQDTMVPTNYFQYRLDLNQANKNLQGPLIWDNVFNFIEEYGAKSMRPKDINDVVERQLLDKKLTKKFIMNSLSGNWVEPPSQNERQVYCQLKSSLAIEEDICNNDKASQSTEIKIVTKLLGKWRRRID